MLAGAGAQIEAIAVHAATQHIVLAHAVVHERDVVVRTHAGERDVLVVDRRDHHRPRRVRDGEATQRAGDDLVDPADVDAQCHYGVTSARDGFFVRYVASM